MKDVMQWAETKNGIFLVKSFYNTFKRDECFSFLTKAFGRHRCSLKSVFLLRRHLQVKL